MSSTSPDTENKPTSNALLNHNSSDMAQINASKATNNTNDLYTNHEIPMNLLPAGNS